MTTAVAIASILFFLVAFRAAKVASAASAAVGIAVRAMKTLASNELDDETKEVASRKAAIDLVICALSIAARFSVSIVGAGIPIFAADALDLANANDTIAYLSRWDVILVSTIVLTVLFLVGRRLWPTK